MIKITQHQQIMWVRDHSEYITGGDTVHRERHLVTTVWFLFIPLFKLRKFISCS